jgi:hypothetical protein
MFMNNANPQKILVEYFGNEKNPVVVIDNFCAGPETLVALACTEPAFKTQSSDFYPGIRKLITGDYAQTSLRLITPIIHDIFSVAHTQAARISLSAFSLATTTVEKLRPIQCVPHIDTHDPHQFALVHYLCADNYGGTSFYRHKATGHETITETRMENYFRILKQEVTSGGLPLFDYINGDTELFERIGAIEIKFNRAILYRSNALHSGNISASQGLSSDPKKGRLTANSFINFSLEK